MSRALQAYRASLRATHTAFKGDAEVLRAARNQIRQGFEQHKDLAPEQANEEIVKLNEVSTFLVKNIVQGKKDQEGKYFLNFHEGTELGDNETIKQNNKANLGSLAGAKTKKCSDK